MTTTTKIVLVSRTGYNRSHDDLLRELLARRIRLFCAVGRDCVLWEDAMDWIAVGPTGEGSWDVITTSHPDERIVDVVEFAETFHLDEPGEVEVIEV